MIKFIIGVLIGMVSNDAAMNRDFKNNGDESREEVK